MLPNEAFGRRLKELRAAKNLSTRQLADMIYVSQPTITRWETGERMPDISMLSRLAACLGVKTSDLLDSIGQSENEPAVVILVDDERIILTGSLHTLERVMPKAQIFAFSQAEEALKFAENNRVDIAFLDIELGGMTGLELAEKLEELVPQVNVIFLTSYSEYMGKAWDMHASGYILKPLDENRIREELSVLRHPVKYSTGA